MFAVSTVLPETAGAPAFLHGRFLTTRSSAATLIPKTPESMPIVAMAQHEKVHRKHGAKFSALTPGTNQCPRRRLPRRARACLIQFSEETGAGSMIEMPAAADKPAVSMSISPRVPQESLDSSVHKARSHGRKMFRPASQVNQVRLTRGGHDEDPTQRRQL